MFERDYERDLPFPWVEKFPDSESWPFSIEICFEGTAIMERHWFSYADGGRYILPFPVNSDFRGGGVYAVSRFDYNLCKIMNTCKRAPGGVFNKDDGVDGLFRFAGIEVEW